MNKGPDVEQKDTSLCASYLEICPLLLNSEAKLTPTG